MKILIRYIPMLCLATMGAGCASMQPVHPQPALSSPRSLSLQSPTGPADPAEQQLQERTRAQPDDPDAWFRLGNYYAEQDQLEKAEQAYREALQRSNHTAALHNLGLVQIRMGVRALQDAARQLPPQDPVHAETREFLRMVLETASGL
jgi:cytochrome c-type biogenesis protein CcmH/NrfG